MRTSFVFITSIFACIFALIAERILGISWDYHPDVETYITTYKDIVAGGLEVLPNQLYFFITYILQGSVSALITLNILAFSVTNVVLAKVYSRYSKFKDKRSLVFLFILIFAPYRIHLAVHGLKDTLVILMLCFFTTYRCRLLYSFLPFFSLLLLRIYSLFYMLLFLRGRILFVLVAILLGLILSLDLSWLDFLIERNEVSMHSRDFDTIPSFSDLGIEGAVLRMIVWPFILITGLFIVMAPSVMFIPIAFEIIAFRICTWRFLGSFGISLSLLMFLAVISASVNSFTSFLRYAYPALVVMPIILMQSRLELSKSNPCAQGE